jgi:two-component system chemotaxis response regulator CheY
MEKTKVLLADSSAFVRIILSNGLGTLGFEVVAVAQNGQEALEMYAQHRPDITLIDLKLDNSGGIEVIRALIKNNPLAVIAVMMPENMDDPDVIVEAVRAGAKAYIKKPTSVEEMKKRLVNLVGRRKEK